MPFPSHQSQLSILIAFLIYYFSLLNSLAQRDAIVKPTDSNYLDRCAMFTSGRLTRFKKSTISVFIAPISVSRNLINDYQQTIVESFQQWEIETGLAFSFVAEKQSADIRIFWNHHRQIGSLHLHGGESVMLQPENSEDQSLQIPEIQVEIEIFVRQTKQFDFLLPNQLQTVLLHEIGHAIGIWGHSREATDIMYFEPMVDKLSQRDIVTANLLLQKPPNTPLHQLSLKALKADLVGRANPAEYLYAIGLVYVDLGNYESAMSVFEKAIAINPLAKKVAWQMAQIRQQDSNYELALKDYLRSINDKPTAKKLGAIGTIYLLQGNYDLALNYLEQALRSAPNSEALKKNTVAAYHHKIVTQRKSGYINAALETLTQGLKVFPDSRILLSDLGSTYEKMKLYNKAYQIYDEILQSQPNHVDTLISMAATLNNLGAEVAEKKQWEQAIGYYRQALDYDVNCWEAQHNLVETLLFKGWKHTNIQAYSEAVTAFSEVIKYDPKNTTAYYNLGVSLYSQGQINAANKAFNQVLTLDPNHSDALDYLRQIEKHQKSARLKKILLAICSLLGIVFIIVLIFVRQKKIHEKIAN